MKFSKKITLNATTKTTRYQPVMQYCDNGKTEGGACVHLSHKTAVYHPLFHITLFEF